VHGWPRACQVRNRRQEALGRRLTSRWKSQLRPRRRRRGDAEGQSERRWGRFSCAPSCGAAAGRGFNGEAVMRAQPTKCCNALPSCDAGRGNLPGSGSRPPPRWLGLFSAAGNRASPPDLPGTIQAACSAVAVAEASQQGESEAAVGAVQPRSCCDGRGFSAASPHYTSPADWVWQPPAGTNAVGDLTLHEAEGHALAGDGLGGGRTRRRQSQLRVQKRRWRPAGQQDEAWQGQGGC
jgi:hypothetical protein